MLGRRLLPPLVVNACMSAGRCISTNDAGTQTRLVDSTESGCGLVLVMMLLIMVADSVGVHSAMCWTRITPFFAAVMSERDLTSTLYCFKVCEDGAFRSEWIRMMDSGSVWHNIRTRQHDSECVLASPLEARGYRYRAKCSPATSA